MKNQFHILTSLALPMLVLLFAFNLKIANADLNGNIMGVNNNPISNVDINLLKQGKVVYHTQSDDQGNFILKGITPNKYQLKIAYKKFKPYESELAIKEGSNLLYVILDEKNKTISLNKSVMFNIGVVEEEMEIEEVVFESRAFRGNDYEAYDEDYSNSGSLKARQYSNITISKREQLNHNTEEYNYITENGYKLPKQEPLSTFSIDADGAAYANTRRFLKDGRLPPTDAIRIEEFINYFSYDYSEPTGKDPFSINTEVAECPWNNKHKLMLIGLKGKETDKSEMPANNLVFLLDVSGSMDSPNKLGLVKKSLKMMINQLNEKDKIAIVVYAGASGEVLPSTKVGNKQKILEALDKLEAGGSTAGAEGIELAYKVAEANFKKNGNNRIILCTDGDFNVGISSESEMIHLIEQKRKSGIFLSVFGFGTGNLKDSKMEQIANHGNGTYNYIDNLSEAQKLFVNEAGGTLLTIAKDVKIQVEFNPAIVGAYRLIGYENRMLNVEDFNDDTKDAGEIGAGHTITAIYEIVPFGVELPKSPKVDNLKYQNPKTQNTDHNGELATVKFRYKAPDGDVSKLISKVVDAKAVSFNEASNNLKFSAAISSWGMLLRNSEYKGNTSYPKVIYWAQDGKGIDTYGYRGEFIQLVRLSQSLDLKPLTSKRK